MKTYNNFIEITENSISKTEENDIINFTSPLSITDDSRQWNMTKYDIPSLDISHYDGLVTVNHGQDIADVVGKVINLRKDEQGHKVLIDGIKFAVNSNPVAILAKNLMKDGFVTGVSIETLGGEADQTGTWLGHKLCGLSIVAHPNNLNAYATIGNYRQAVANSIQEAQKNGLDTSKIENAAKDLEDTKSIYFFDKKNYNSNMETAKETVKKNSNRLSSLLDKVENGGPGSGNPNPGQGRGKGKPAGGGAGLGHNTGPSTSEKKSSYLKFAGEGRVQDVLPTDTRWGGEPRFEFSEFSSTPQTDRYGYGSAVGYKTSVISPFKIDEDSAKEMSDILEKYDSVREQASKDYSELNKIARMYKDDNGWSLHSPSEGEINKYITDSKDKETALSLRRSYDENQKQAHSLSDKLDKIEKTASYKPNGLGMESAVLMAGVIHGASNYNGQRSDGMGESSFGDNVERYVDSKAQAYVDLDRVLRSPYSVDYEEFTRIKNNAAKLASNQAAYLKRVETSVNNTNFENSQEMRNVSQTIKSLEQSAIMDDLASTKPKDVLVAGKTGYEIKRIGIDY